MKIALYCRDMTGANGMTKSTVLAAQAFHREGHDVRVLSEKYLLAAELVRLFGPAARGLRVEKAGDGRRLVAATAGYDLFINQLPGAYFPSMAKRSWLWVHAVPLSKPRHLSFYRILANSKFTQGRLRRLWRVSSEVLYPPVSTGDFTPMAKEKMILSVGTLGGVARPKNELQLIRLFKKLHDRGRLPGWSYHLAGELEGGRAWLAKLKAEAAGAPVYLHVRVALPEMKRLYGRAALLWHACRCEHFGIAIVEAMAAGCLPLVYDRGGPREIIAHGRTGWRYRSMARLGELTLAALEGRAAATARRGRSVIYGTDAFRERARGLLIR